MRPNPNSRQALRVQRALDVFLQNPTEETYDGLTMAMSYYADIHQACPSDSDNYYGLMELSEI